jgi:uncharacterized membrane protein (DUF4010 family)
VEDYVLKSPPVYQMSNTTLTVWPWTGLAVAAGAGLLIGVEREYRLRSPQEHEGTGGVRTFALVCLAGALCNTLEIAGVFASGVLLLGALSALSYYRNALASGSMTTEVALFVTYLIGGAAITQPALAAALAVVVTILLAGRTRLHHFIRNTITQEELHDGLMLAAGVLVVLPLVPDVPVSWLAGLNLRKIWTVLVMLLVIQSLEHIALRVFGARYGLVAAGAISGFVSSTAAIAALGLQAKKTPALVNAHAAGALASCVGTFVQLLMLSFVLFPAAAQSIGWICLAGLAAVVAGTGLFWRRGQTEPAAFEQQRRMFNLLHTLLFAVLLGGITAFSTWVNTAMGLNAAITVTVLAALADFHAAAASALTMGAGGQTSLQHTLLLVLVAFSANTASKIVACMAGGGPFIRRVAPTLIVIALCAWAAWFWVAA